MRLLLLALSLTFAAPAFAQRAQIEISGANFKPVALAIPEVRIAGDKAIGTEIDAALTNDLEVSGLVELLDRKGFLDPAKDGLTAATIDFKRWLDVAAELLLKGNVVADGQSIRAEFRLFSVSTGKEELKLNLAVGPSEGRRIAHQVANALYKFLTKEPGPFESRIAFERKVAGGKEIVVADWDGQRARTITKGGLNLMPSWSPDGSKVVFTSYQGGNPDLYVHDVNSGQTTALVKKGALCTGAAFSPDGKRVAFAMSEGETSHIWVVDTEGSNAQRLTDGYGIRASPSWSPDGKRIAFVSNQAGSPQVYAMASSGGAATRLTFQGNYNQTPDWSPRGDLIAFTARDERNVFDLFTLAVEGGKVTRLTQDTGHNESPTFAPNGRLVAFISTRSGGSDLWVMSAEGQKPKRITTGSAVSNPAWGPLPR